MKFWVKINGDIGTEGGISLWNSIKYAGVNLTQLFDESYVYGDVSPYVLKDILYHIAVVGKPIELELPSKTPA